MGTLALNGLNHIGVKVRDIEASKAYYRDILDAEFYHDDEVGDGDEITKVSFFRIGDCRVELIQPPVFESVVNGVVEHIAFDVTGIDAAKAELESRGVTFLSEVNHLPSFFDNGCKYVLFKGPDGEILELNEVL